LEELWETFLTSISSSVSDYLSVEHLGMILDRLAEQGIDWIRYFSFESHGLNKENNIVLKVMIFNVKLKHSEYLLKLVEMLYQESH
jgi:hypothetical protein